MNWLLYISVSRQISVLGWRAWSESGSIWVVLHNSRGCRVNLLCSNKYVSSYWSGCRGFSWGSTRQQSFKSNREATGCSGSWNVCSSKCRPNINCLLGWFIHFGKSRTVRCFNSGYIENCIWISKPWLYFRVRSLESASWRSMLLGTFCAGKLNSWNSRCQQRRYSTHQ